MSRLCRTVERAVAAGEETPEVAAHLRGCSSCRGLSEALVLLKAAGQTLPRPPYVVGSGATVSSRAERPRWRPALLLAGAVAVGAVVLALAGGGRHAWRQPGTATPPRALDEVPDRADRVDLLGALSLAEGIYRTDSDEVPTEWMAEDPSDSSAATGTRIYEDIRPEDLLPRSAANQKPGR
ncbi:MAG: hypothetical protein IT371_17410 [Deltaproteobacteria bacterium]|nr:hypothetical protein [Deltaproteobacteria bacterium]